MSSHSFALDKLQINELSKLKIHKLVDGEREREWGPFVLAEIIKTFPFLPIILYGRPVDFPYTNDSKGKEQRERGKN
jgi:hypothetical protein